ncbi:MAG: ABC transporter substrate-binding protein [bacterium]
MRKLLNVSFVVLVICFLVSPLMGKAVAAGKYSEAPMLARLVSQGKLPPVEKRLPDVPVVAGPGVIVSKEWLDWTPGKYSDGKVLKTVAMSLKSGIMDLSANNFLWAPEQSTKDPMPVLVEKFSHSPDYKVFDFTIRKGLKWSNGDEVTTEDVRFTFEDLYQYPDCGIAYPSNLHSQGNLKYPVAKLSIKDKHSFTLTFDRPYGYFIADLRSWITDSNMILRPSRFLKQYHPKYTDVKKLDEMAKKEGLVDWRRLLQAKADTHWARSRNPQQIGVPCLQAWVPVEITDTHIKLERNPYYPWVDTEGKQLPYIDAIEVDIVTNNDAKLMKIVSGDIDYAMDDFMKLNEMPTYLQGAEKVGYRIFLSGSINNPPLLFINQDFEYDKPNSQWQRLVQDPQKRFGRAVALAIDKGDVNRSLYFGRYGMDTVTTAEYDPAKANQLLDELGMTKRDAQGFRTYPDGSPLSITIVCHGISPDQIEISFMCARFLQAIGINATAKQVAPSIFDQKMRNNEYQMTVIWNDGPIWRTGISQDYWPAWKGGWAPMSARYIETDGKEGRKPPAYIQEFFDIHTERKAWPPESPEGAKLFEKLLKYFADNYVMIWPIGSVVQPNMASQHLKNIPKEGYPFNLSLTETAPQWYFD